MSSSRFTKLLRDRLPHLGIGREDCVIYTGHSLKRSAVQLYRSIGLRDEYIMKKVQMSGSRAYANYCAAYNDCGTADLSIFTNIEDYIKHAKHIAGDE